MCRLRALNSENSTYFHYGLSVVIRKILCSAIIQLNLFLCPNGLFFPRNFHIYGPDLPKEFIS